MLTAAYGLCVELDLPHPQFSPPAELPGGPQLHVTLAAPVDVERAWSGSSDPPWRANANVDGIPWLLEHGRGGDVRVAHGETLLHIDATATHMLCAPADPGSPAWQRALLDTGLVTASLARGFDALHAGAVALHGGCLVLLGARGAGKTTLTLELVRGGAELIADDVVVVRRDDEGTVWAQLAPPLANLPATMPIAGLGEVLHDFESELWLRVDRAAQRPLPLKAIVVIDREAGGAGDRLERVDDPAVSLLSHALHSGVEPHRRARRFALLADIAATTPVLRLAGAAQTPAAALAELLRAELPA